MQFQPSQEQRELAASMDGAIAAILPAARCHEDHIENDGIWQELNELGLFSLALDEPSGGLGLGAVEEALIAITLGRHLASPSVFATLGCVHAQAVDAKIAGVRTASAVQSETRTTMIGDGLAAHILVRSPDAAGVYASGTGQALLNGNPWLDDVTPSSHIGTLLGAYDQQALLRLTLLDAAALAGLADTALHMAVEYSKLREQFGRPIGSFQAIKHHCANMAVAARSAQDLVTFAAVAIDHQREDAAFLVNSAFVTAANAASGNAAKNIQIHAGIGFSAEADAHLFVKRAQILIAIGGGVEAALDRIALNDMRTAAIGM